MGNVKMCVQVLIQPGHSYPKLDLCVQLDLVRLPWPPLQKASAALSLLGADFENIVHNMVHKARRDLTLDIKKWK